MQFNILTFCMLTCHIDLSSQRLLPHLWMELRPDGLKRFLNWIGGILYLGWRRWPAFVLQWKAVWCQGEEPGFGLCDHFIFEVGRVTVVLFVSCVLLFDVLPQHVLSQGYAFDVLRTVCNIIFTTFSCLWIILADSVGWENCLEDFFGFNLFNNFIKERWQNFYIYFFVSMILDEMMSFQLSCFYSRFQASLLKKILICILFI